MTSIKKYKFADKPDVIVSLYLFFTTNTNKKFMKLYTRYLSRFLTTTKKKKAKI
jgi:hypothetical protein